MADSLITRLWSLPRLAVRSIGRYGAMSDTLAIGITTGFNHFVESFKMAISVKSIAGAFFLLAYNLEPSMSRRGNCWGNALAESFFNSLKKERIRKRIYKTRELARADVFDYISVLQPNPPPQSSGLHQSRGV